VIRFRKSALSPAGGPLFRCCREGVGNSHSFFVDNHITVATRLNLGSQRGGDFILRALVGFSFETNSRFRLQAISRGGLVPEWA